MSAPKATQKGTPAAAPAAEVTPQSNTPETAAEIVPQHSNALIGTFDFQTLASAPAAEVRGFRLIGQEPLEGLPFVIVGVHIRDGVKRMTEKGKTPTNYLSVECVTADEVTLTRLIKASGISQGGTIVRTLDDLQVRPNEMVVFNDGGTGVARQLVQFLHMTGRINVGDASKPNGGMGESSFDRYHGDWVTGGRDVSNPDAEDPAFYGSPLLKCMRGLRYSDYVSDMTDENARTWYLG